LSERIVIKQFAGDEVTCRRSDLGHERAFERPSIEARAIVVEHHLHDRVVGTLDPLRVDRDTQHPPLVGVRPRCGFRLRSHP
jgi:hypothetical protein